MTPEMQLACACDSINSWARECGVNVCVDPFDELTLRDTINDVWEKESHTIAVLRNENAKLRERLQKGLEIAERELKRINPWA